MANDWDVVEEKKIGEWDVVGQTEVPPGGSMPISTITGQPVPTSAENVFQTKGALRTIGPAVGDIAGTLAAQSGANALFPGGGAAIPFAQKILPALMRYGMKVGGAAAGGR